jgi:DNA-binding NtrC family response regulator
MNSILVATKSPNAHKIIADCFQSKYEVEVAREQKSCVEKFRKKRYEYVFIDIEILRDGGNSDNYKELLQSYWKEYPTTEIVILAAQELVSEAVKAVRAGACNYLTYPLNPDAVRHVATEIDDSVQLYSELDYLRDKYWRSEPLSILRTYSPAMKEIFKKIHAVAQTESTVLLTGETGTGKGVIANLIHRLSKRSKNQFIILHCGAIPETLLESELFGHEKGAFTGAVQRKLGKFQIANGGTIFLDEIGTISPSVQIKMLQVLQDKTFQRIGGTENITANVRVVAATNADLEKMCEDGSFRPDLYYRLNGFPIELPPLRERIEDIPLLVEFFINRLNKFNAKNIRMIAPEVLEALQSYSWPGNIRELENLIERAYILESSPILTAGSFPRQLFEENGRRQNGIIDTSLPLKEVRRRIKEKTERQYLTELLSKHHGRIANSAEAAGISVRQLHKLMTKYDLRKEDFKSPSGFTQSEQKIPISFKPELKIPHYPDHGLN